MEAILEPLMRSPKFPRYVDELVELRRQEDLARRRFRDSLDEDVRAEFINGEVVEQMSSRGKHTVTVANIGGLLRTFVQLRHLGTVRSEQALAAFTRNDYVPDICFWSKARSAQFTGDTTIYPVPDFVCEVLSPRTEERDRGVKFEDYASHGVREYWIVDADAEVIEQYLESTGRYELSGKFGEGVVRSAVIEGFEMPTRAVFDEEAYLVALRKLLTPGS